MSSTFAELCTSAAGLKISSVWRGHGSAVFVEMGVLTPKVRMDGSQGNPEGELGLMVEWSWRIEASRSITCGSWSDEALWEPAFDKLRSSRLLKCEVFGILPEIVLSTDTGVRFISFSTTDGQPQWSLFDRRRNTDCWYSVVNGEITQSN